MARHLLVVHVTVVEQDENGNIVARLCEHSERGPLPDVPADAEQCRQDQCQWAYRGFNLARNGPLGVVEPDPGVPRLGLLVLTTSQVEAVRAFYAALGVSFTEERHGEGSRHYTGRLGPLDLEVYPLQPSDEGTADTTTRLGFGVDDLSGAINALQALGIEVSPSAAIQGGIKAAARDPDGRTVELSEWPRSLR